MEKNKVIQISEDNSKNVVESIIFTRSQSAGNIYRMRFLLRIVELARQVNSDNMDIVTSRGTIEVKQFGHPLLTVPVRSLLSGEDKNYVKARQSVLDCLNWIVTFEDERNYKAMHIFYDPGIEKQDGMLQFLLNEKIWHYLVDYTKGNSQYDLDVVLPINNKLALEIYKSLPNLKGTLSYSIDRFREVFGYKDKYKNRPSALVKYALEPAKQELDKKSTWTFEYELQFDKKDGSMTGRKRITGITIVPVHRVGNEPNDAARMQVHPAQLIR